MNHVLWRSEFCINGQATASNRHSHTTHRGVRTKNGHDPGDVFVAGMHYQFQPLIVLRPPRPLGRPPLEIRQTLSQRDYNVNWVRFFSVMCLVSLVLRLPTVK